MFSLSTLYFTTVDWSLTTQIKQWERNVVLGWAGVCGERWKTNSPNSCVGGVAEIVSRPSVPLGDCGVLPSSETQEKSGQGKRRGFFGTDFLPLGLQEGSLSITTKVKARSLWITVNYLSAPRPTSSPGRFSLALLEEKRPGDEAAPRLLGKNRRLIVGNLHINKVCKLKKVRDGPLFFWRGGGEAGLENCEIDCLQRLYALK